MKTLDEMLAAESANTTRVRNVRIEFAQECSDYIETIKAYESQGYVRPAGASYLTIATRHALSGLDPVFVPVACGGGATAWGVPFVNGAPLPLACALTV